MKTFIRSASIFRFIFAVTALLLAVSACATGPRQAFHNFSFDGKSGKWGKEVDLLEYTYGNQYHMVRDRVRPEKERLGPQSSVTGLMPITDFYMSNGESRRQAKSSRIESISAVYCRRT